jgi:hypothetical protein
MKQEDKYTTLRIWTSSVQKLRLIYALTGETMVKILDRLLTDELKRIQASHDHHENL